MDKKKIGFFKKILLAITDFRFYPHVLKNESTSQSFWHFVAFLMLLTLIISIKVTGLVYDKLDVFLDQYDEIVPDFIIDMGVLDVDYMGTKEIRNDMVAIVDTSYRFEDCIESEQYKAVSKYDNVLMINSDAISLIDAYGTIYQADLSYIGGTFTKDSFGIYINMLATETRVKIFVVYMIFVAMFMMYAIYKFVEVIFFGILALFISALAGIRINYKAQMKIVLYAMTLPYIVEVISILYVGAIKEYTILVSGILAYVYIFYAIRAIKLDMLLMIMSNDKKGAFKLKVDPDGKYEIKKIEQEEKKDGEKTEETSEVDDKVSDIAKEIEETEEKKDDDNKKENDDNKE